MIETLQWSACLHLDWGTKSSQTLVMQSQLTCNVFVNDRNLIQSTVGACNNADVRMKKNRVFCFCPSFACHLFCLITIWCSYKFVNKFHCARHRPAVVYNGFCGSPTHVHDAKGTVVIILDATTKIRFSIEKHHHDFVERLAFGKPLSS